MKNPESNLWSQQKVTIGAFLLCFFIVGIPFWKIPYSNVSLPNAFFGVGVLAVFVVAALLCVSFRFSFRRGLVVPGAAYPAALMIRVVVEGAMEPSRHNLWPLALIIAVLLGVVVAGSGALLGWLTARLLR